MDSALRDYPFIIRRAGDRQFIAHTEALMESNSGRFEPNPVDPVRRKFWQIEEDIDACLAAKKLELIERFGIKDWVADPNYYDLICCISEGGRVHPHMDSESAGKIHVRLNLLISEPEAGCVPLLDGKPIDIGAGDAWLCFASRCEHATTHVIGKKDRVIVSYGTQVDRVSAFPLMAQYLSWKLAH